MLAAPASQVRDWHFQKGAFEKLSPPWEKVTVVETPSRLTDGARAIIRVGIGPFKQRWVAVHEVTDNGFIDRQEEGPFSFWEHRHSFVSVGGETCRLVDSIHYRLPLGWLGKLFGGALVRRKLERMFAYRHEVTRQAFIGGG